MINYIKVDEISSQENIIAVCDKGCDFSELGISEDELEFVKKQVEQDRELISINQYIRWIFLYIIDKDQPEFLLKEKSRTAACDLYTEIKKYKVEKLTLISSAENNSIALAFAEGLGLSDYQFLKYYKDAVEKKSALKEICIFCESINSEEIERLNVIVKAVHITRNLINEPLSFLTAEQLVREIEILSEEAGFSLTVLDKRAIEKEKMGGLLAVNRGSIDPPTFSILEWKPDNATNENPYVLVGKGIVFDTGGLSLKPTPDSMEFMKCDMGGAAAVIGAVYAVAKAKLPVHLIGLVPATDNRPDGNAYVPGDVITMHNGLTVEVLNTDAEGRLILADALSYAQRYNPAFVIDLATLTGAAAMAVGKYGVVGMGNAGEELFEKLQLSGENTYERVVELPFWDDYDELLESDIADLKNIGGKEAGAITAGKFLEHFTDYPYIHLDIAGPIWLKKKYSYRGKGGSGVGVRLLFDFFKTIQARN